MLKHVFRMFEPTEAQFTPAAIRRLKWASIFALPFAPLSVFLFLAERSTPRDTSDLVLLVLMILSALAMIYCCGARPLNRAWTPDKYLDESEIARKRQSASFAFFWTIGLAMIVGLVWLTCSYIGLALPEILSHPNFGLAVLAVLVCWAFCFQGYKISQILSPLSDRGETVKITSGDKKYWLKYVVWLAFAILASMAIVALDGRFDAKAKDRAFSECGEGNVKSVDTKGLFQTRIICGTGDSSPDQK